MRAEYHTWKLERDATSLCCIGVAPISPWISTDFIEIDLIFDFHLL